MNQEVTNLTKQIAKELRALADSVEQFGTLMVTDTGGATEPATKEEAEKEVAITFEQLRAVLSEKSKDGFTAEVKAIIEAHGGNRLSDIKEEDYAKVLKQAEVLGDG